MAFLNASSWGAHLHLCLDGKEPRTTLHVLDGQEDLHHVQASDPHNDVDVKLSEQALTKLFKFDPSSPGLPSAWKVPDVSFTEAIYQSSEFAGQPVSSVRFLLPPLRGPPV